jgi:hypothetical protein
MQKSFTAIMAILLISMLNSSCSFAYKKHVIGKYYLIGVDTKEDVTLSYKLSSGDFIGRAPAKVIACGYKDSLLVAKSLEHKNSNPTYYIINMNRDGEYAHEEVFRVGPLGESEFNKEWNEKLKVSLEAVKL